MNAKSILFFGSFFLLGLCCISCNQNSKSARNAKIDTDDKDSPKSEVVLKDYGAEPTVLNIDSYTVANKNFRTVIWTGKNLQVTLMSIPVGGEIGLELHPHTEQFLRVEEGEAKVMMGKSKDSLNFVKIADSDFAIFVPSNTWHNIINVGDEPLKLYSIYSPVEHPYGAVHKTKKDADEAEHH